MTTSELRIKIIEIVYDKKTKSLDKSSSGNMVRQLLSKRDIYRNEFCDEIIKELAELN